MKAKLVAAIVLLVSVSVFSWGDGEFPPGLRLRGDFNFWTSTSRACDLAWASTRTHVRDAELADDTREAAEAVMKATVAARYETEKKLAQAASRYYAARRGKDVLKRYDEYGKDINRTDLVKMQSYIGLYIDIGQMLSLADLEKLEKTLLERARSITNALELDSEIAADPTSEYIEHAAGMTEHLFAIAKAGADIAEARASYAKASESMVAYVRDFYYVTPGSVDVFFYEDDKGRKWVQFEKTPVSPYVTAGDEAETEIKVLEYESDEETVEELLSNLRAVEKVYRKVTLDGIQSLAELMPEKVADALKALGAQLEKTEGE